ncbi:MAG: formate dehydrogenase accessory protein FdhE [Desulfovibrionales bacterium]|jgi:FdhE protein|nr:formate dehydrogenase accessory protein FdhE [Desulfovibrionales bacterium]
MTSTGTPSKESAVNNFTIHHEAFQKIIERFGVLLRRQEELQEKLEAVDMSMENIDEQRFLGGEPVVSFVPSQDFEPLFQVAAKDIWPVLSIIFPPLAESLKALGQKLETDTSWAHLCLQAVAHGNAQALDQAATQAIVAPDFLLLALRAAYGPCIAVQKDNLIKNVPIEVWRQAYCPVCGSDPDLATLENHPDPSEFLVSKSGELWHHCPTCTHRWRFVRMQCPNCGNKDHKSLTRFNMPDSLQTIIYACEQCQHYLPCLNLVENSQKINFNQAALNLVHLDAAAQSKGYTPLSPAPWAVFGFDQEKPS